MLDRKSSIVFVYKFSREILTDVMWFEFPDNSNNNNNNTRAIIIIIIRSTIHICSIR